MADPDPGSPPEAAADEPPPETAEAEPDEEEGESESGVLPRNPLAEYHFHGAVDASGARFGISDGRASRRSTGPVDAADIDAALRCYVAPEPYDSALAVLRDNHLVVLAGAEGTGRRAGAYALLRQVVGGARLTSLSPAYTLIDLNIYSFKTGLGYLVVDRLREDAADEVQRFEADRLRHRLRSGGAYLVITALPRAVRSASELVVEWQRPDPDELLDRCLTAAGVRPTGAERDQLRERNHERPQPREVVALCDRVSEKGVDSALRAGQDEDRQRIRAWFDDKPPMPDLLEATTAAFAYGLPQLTFERLQRRLRELVDAAAGRDGSEGGDPADNPLPQSRAARGGADGLVTTVQDEPDAPRRVVFRADRYREGVLTELAARFGYELWEPVDRWLRELARSLDRKILSQISLGLALHARRAFDEVSPLLQDWSDGTVTERLTAAYVLSWMCFDDDLGSVALRTATGWAVRSGPRRAWTAAVALGGELGVRYQSEALRWLWELTIRPERISRPARESIADLFRGAEQDPASATTVLNYLHSELRRTIRDQGAARTRSAHRTVLAVLRADRRNVDQPVAAHVLRDQHGTAAVLGALWAEVLRSASHRDDAIEALRRTVCLIGQDGTAERAVRDLGAAIRSAWSGDERTVLLEQLEWALRSRTTRAPDGRRLLLVLLDALEARHDDRGRRQ
jgi:hypothetical protein